MAGVGWSKQGSGIPLEDRVRVGQHQPGRPATTQPEPDPCPYRHVWVADAVDGHGIKRPGLLLEWRRGPDGWEGLVAYGAHLRADAWAMALEWMPGELLTPT